MVPSFRHSLDSLVFSIKLMYVHQHAFYEKTKIVNGMKTEKGPKTHTAGGNSVPPYTNDVSLGNFARLNELFGALNNRHILEICVMIAENEVI